MPRSPQFRSPQFKSKGPGAQPADARARGWQDPLRPQQPLVSGRWLLRAFGLVVLVAAVCAYLTLCLLFAQGQWQVVFHPSRTITTTPAMVGLRYDEVRFDYTESGTAQLAGWWIPAEARGRYASSTLLYFHDGRGSLSDVTRQLASLHTLGINIFSFDYRGFGQSADVHPSERRVYEDADAAWNYLTRTRHLDPKSIVLYGDGLGATIAAETALRHRESPALILENPSPPALTLIAADARTSLLPVKLLFRDRFELAPKLRATKTPKLFLFAGDPYMTYGKEVAANAADPKMLAVTSSPLEPVRQFLEQQLPSRQ